MTLSYNRVHVWIGSNFCADEDYLAYFALDYSAEGDFDAPGYKLCGFCRDIGVPWYDEDFIGVMPRHRNNVSLDDILVDAAVDRDEFDAVKRRCKSLGVTQANAIFWYQDAELRMPEPVNATFNGLTYIGEFEGD
ncbi:immunity 22 family protein [Variovorax sp. H27-G14]|uniref:immunity 22 family protein n=1 Tax=Variovorax sp. H27-G14 TaxID=3111914 RepID=UPI0038FBE8D1